MVFQTLMLYLDYLEKFFYDEAVKWWRKAAQNGNEDAQKEKTGSAPKQTDDAQKGAQKGT